uniref:Transporter n=1 Tax=Caenorhabditis japonica TaxID=281687 RepID=A0A8R1HZG3_CAEJA
MWEELERRLKGVRATNADQKFAQLEAAGKRTHSLRWTPYWIPCHVVAKHCFQYEYLFPILNVCIGFANVLVFPAKVYEYRGGAYLIAYLFWIIMVGYPLVYLELIIGQYHRCSPIVFLRRCAPIFRGLGWMTVVSSLLILYNVQYSVARALKFVVALTRTRSNSMPWARCDNPWNTKYCYQFFSEECENLKEAHIMYQGQCVKDSELDPMMIVSAEKQYVENMIHSAGGSLMSFVNFDWGIFYAILLVWLSIAFVNNRGSFKGNFLVYIPAIAIFLICPFLLIRSLRLDGAGSGIREMFKIDWPQLLYSKIWIDALSNVIVSLGIGAGGHTVIASFAPYRKHTFTSGPLYQNIIDDIQTLTCGLFLTAQLLIVIECYGIDQIYLDIYALMRPPGNWNRFYCLSMWSSRWRMAPAFTLIYAFLPFLLRTHSNMHNDVDYVYFYEEHLPERDPEDKRGNWEQMYILADTELTEKEKKELMRNNRDSASH